MNSTPFPPDTAADDVMVVLPANGTTVAAEDLQARLVLAADLAGEIRIDAAAVENVGQAVLQLLLAAREEAEAKGIDFTIANPSPAFRARVTACRLEDALGLTIQEEPVQ